MTSLAIAHDLRRRRSPGLVRRSAHTNPADPQVSGPHALRVAKCVTSQGLADQGGLSKQRSPQRVVGPHRADARIAADLVDSSGLGVTLHAAPEPVDLRASACTVGGTPATPSQC